MWHCYHPKHTGSTDKAKNDGSTNAADSMPTLNIHLPDGQRFGVPVWALFWVGPLMWWGVVSFQILAAGVIVALVLGVRAEFSTAGGESIDEDAPRKPKNDEV